MGGLYYMRDWKVEFLVKLGHSDSTISRSEELFRVYLLRLLRCKLVKD